jgi:hypothetical protein
MLTAESVENAEKELALTFSKTHLFYLCELGGR